MQQIELTGLKSGIPIGFLAALGAFCRLSQLLAPATVKLGWARQAGQWCALLNVNEPCGATEIVDALAVWTKQAGARAEFSWADQIKKHTPGEFRDFLDANPNLEGWFAAFASELITAKDGTIRSTPLDMTGGQQKFLLKLRQLSEFLANAADAPAMFHEALFGPWRYKESARPADAETSHSLGLDPATILKGAMTSQAPTNIHDKRGIRGAVWLAFESLPLFPCICAQARPLAPCFKRENSLLYFRWPIWETPLSLQSVKTLLMQSANGLPRERGVAAEYRAERKNLEKDYYAFSSAELVTG